MAKRAKQETGELNIEQLKIGKLKFWLMSDTPLIMHRFSKKAREELLLPRGELNRAEKAENLKHDPIAEYRESIYRNREIQGRTFIHFPAGAFGKAMASAALDIPGATKAQVARLTSVVKTHVDLWGVPKLFMSMVRNSDQGRTPDIRTRAIFPEWAVELEAEFVSTLIREGQFGNLLAASGRIRGIGDWRPEKGGPHGRFIVADATDPQLKRILETGGREPQMKAYATPECYDYETEELMAFYVEETKRREKKVPSDSFRIEDLEIPPAHVIDAGKQSRKSRALALATAPAPVIANEAHLSRRTKAKANGRARKVTVR